MSFPSVTIADIREEFPAITSDLLADSKITSALTKASNIVESKFFDMCDWTSIKALATTPETIKEVVFNFACAYVIKKFYSEFRGSKSADDISAYLAMANDIVEQLEHGKTKIVDSNGVLWPFGIYYASIGTNKSFSNDGQNGRPYFGMGDLGESLAEQGNRTNYTV